MGSQTYFGKFYRQAVNVLHLCCIGNETVQKFKWGDSLHVFEGVGGQGNDFFFKS